MVLSELTAETGPHPFIYGSETELAINVLDTRYPDIASLFDNYPICGALTLALADNIPSDESDFISNGGRLYLDGEHLEVSTPECYGLYQLVTYELAMEQIAVRGLSRLVEDGWLNGFQINKRSSDHEGNRWGAHENCSNNWAVDYDNTAYQKRLNDARLTHQLTRVIYSGEGGLMPNTGNDRLHYAISPRVAGTDGSMSVQTLAYPTVCSDYKLSSATGGRLQNCAGANVSPWAIAVKHGMNAVLSMLADQQIESIPMLSDPDMAKYFIAGSSMKGLKYSLEDTDGMIWRPTDVQRHIAMVALNDLDLANDEIWACQEVISACDTLDTDPHACADRIDWIKRLQYLSGKHLPRIAFTPNKNLQVQHADFAWDTLAISDESEGIKQLPGVGVKARALGWGWHNIEQASQAEIQEATYTPPNTRAAERVKLLRQGCEEVDYNGNDDYPLPNPYGGNLKNS